MKIRFLLTAIVLLFAGQILAEQTQPSSPDSLLQSAAQAISASNLDRAEHELDLVLSSTPDDARALDLLGVIRVLRHSENEAEDFFKRAVQKNPQFAPSHAHLGLLYLQLRREDEALTELRAATRIDPARTDAAAALVHTLQKQSHAAVDASDFQKALALLNEARKCSPDNSDLQFEFGMVALRLSLFQDASGAFEKALQLRKDDALAHYNLGRAFMGLSKFAEARQQFFEYIKLRPNDPSGHCALGMTQAALEHSEEARIEFQRSIDLEPAQAEAYYRMALLEFGAGDIEAAHRNINHVLDREPTHAGALTVSGKIAFQQKDYARSISILERAIANDDAMREAHYYLGLAFAREGKKLESEEQLEIATRLEREETENRRTVLILGPDSTAPQGTSSQN